MSIEHQFLCENCMEPTDLYYPLSLTEDSRIVCLDCLPEWRLERLFKRYRIGAWALQSSQYFDTAQHRRNGCG